MNVNDKIYKLGLYTLDELLLHRNSSKETIISIDDASILRDLIVHVGPHGLFTFDEDEITEFYQKWFR
jgi:hypothetical protein